MYAWGLCVIRLVVFTESQRKREKGRETCKRGSAGNDPPRDDRLHNVPPGIVRKLIADKIERSQDGIKEKVVNCRDQSSDLRALPGN